MTTKSKALIMFLKWFVQFEMNILNSVKLNKLACKRGKKNKRIKVCIGLFCLEKDDYL